MSHDFADIAVDQEPHSGYYELLETIGKGGFAKVVLGRPILTRIDGAVKIINQQDFYRLHRPLLREVHGMAVLHHPNIVQLFHVINTTESLFLDLKPPNVLFDTQINVKLADFGLGTSFNGRQLSTFCFIPAVVAPELFLGQEYDGRAVDVWSLVVLLYRMITNTLPFKGTNWRELEQKVKPCHPPELQGSSPSPAREVQPECSSFQHAEQQHMDHESGQKAQESASPSVILERTTSTSNPSPGSRTATLSTARRTAPPLPSTDPVRDRHP
ncbi:hypothetical protein mRhiFer1_009956 [Rhinolophus ferrumequinum]|uniref:non-specific serine/threonine protein kinase n=1 Tax=Rhinolophus ferrumequinum TaxID=59479 RepID=A0A7J7YJR9_RHIFE|nr:hypothetical protein mRhiFer1_009956 [Rhinolophus ferrumequinum]